MNNNTGDLNTGFDDFNTGQLNSGIRATLANAGYSTEKQENALNFMVRQSPKKTNKMMKNLKNDSKICSNSS